MAILARKNYGTPQPSGITQLSIIGMITALSAALMNTVWAIYMDSFFNSEVLVGLFSAFLTIIAIVTHFIFIPVIEKADKAKLYASSLLLFMVFYLIFAMNQSFIVMIIVATLMTAFLALRITSWGILVKDASSKQGLSKNEGLVFTFSNMAFVIGPLIAGFISAQYGLRWVFVAAAAVLLIGFFFFKFSGIKGDGGKKRTDKDLYKNFIDFFKNKDRIVAYLVGSGVTSWWILIYLFMPLHMIRNGFSDLAVGYFLFAVAVPLILLEYKFSKSAGKIGFRRVFKIGYLFVAIVAAACFFFTNLYVILGLLVIASVGMAMLEPTTEAYFFDILKGKERYRFYSPYGTSIDFGHLVSKISGAVLLIFLPFKFIFVLFAVWMFVLFFFSCKTRKVIEAKRRGI
ncbi:MAG: MFS transporter [Nanoarchaeota archaeon]|nr:MFS transporter [Nanoarchaeota archaeon]MBU0977387.1 MFS transporter [Nanoarchaeota archaeon]